MNSLPASSAPAVTPPPSPASVERALALLAVHDMPVLLLGEPGSGRGVLAHRVHRLSRRSAGPFVKVDCRGLLSRAAASQALEEAISSAATGSVLLEDVDLLTAPLQVRLMVWLESSRGSRRPRLLSTSRRDLEDEVQRGMFREDLRSRIDVLEIRVPPLRHRRGEIGDLARQLLAESAARLQLAPPVLPPEVERLLVGYAWPGNVRELRNAMERAVALSTGGVVETAALPPRVLAGTS